jgi:hypothetical protein
MQEVLKAVLKNTLPKRRRMRDRAMFGSVPVGWYSMGGSDGNEWTMGQSRGEVLRFQPHFHKRQKSHASLCSYSNQRLRRGERSRESWSRSKHNKRSHGHGTSFY